MKDAHHGAKPPLSAGMHVHVSILGIQAFELVYDEQAYEFAVVSCLDTCCLDSNDYCLRGAYEHTFGKSCRVL